MERPASDTVDVWLADLDAPCDVEACEAMLAPDEVERMRRFRFPRDARRFAMGRAMLRMVLGRYLGLAPDQIEFAYGEWGKPRLRNAAAPGFALFFNLSHSGPQALLGVAPVEIGVDIEARKDDIDVRAVAEVFMSPTERAHLDRLEADERHAAFFAYWCCKEAYMKACGQGVSLPPTSFTVRLGTHTAQLEDDTARWVFHRLAMPDGYEAALVCDSAGELLHTRMRTFDAWPAPTDALPT